MIQEQFLVIAIALSALVIGGVLLRRRSRADSQGRLRSEAELLVREAQLREAQAIAKVGSWEWDIPTDKITWSDQLFTIFDVDKNNFNSSYQAYLNRLPAHHREEIQRSVDVARQTGKGYEFEHQVVYADGSVHYVQSRGVALKNDQGQVIKLMGTAQDITELKKIQEALLLSRSELELRVQERTQQLWEALERERTAKEAKMNFLANMSHEIRTPMNAILGFSELLSDHDLNDQQKALLLRIKTNGDHLLNLIDDILDLSKFEAGRIPVEKSDLHLPHLLQQVVNGVSALAEKKSLKIKVVYETALQEFLKTDALRLRQILNNLLSNAIKFTDNGHITVRVGQHKKPFTKKLSMISIEVEDTGLGISVRDQEKLFQPFTQGDSSGARRFGGTGLGLALSRHIALALDGELSLVRSELGKGSSFRLTMDVGEVTGGQSIGLVGPDDLTSPRISPAAKPEGMVAPGSAKSLIIRPCRILLAEDSPDNEDLVRMYLNFEGVQLDVVQNGYDAIKMALMNNYDLLLMDVQMPGLDGLEATRRLRSHGYHKPIIALTAHALNEDRERSLKAGCTGHLTKPIQRFELIATIVTELSLNAGPGLADSHANGPQ